MIRLFFLFILAITATSIVAQEYSQNFVVHKSLPELEIYLVPENQEENTETHFKIVDKTTKKLFQKSPSFKPQDDYATFEFMDLNFDGYMDLKIAANEHNIPEDTNSYISIDSPSISTVNRKKGTSHCWLYNPKKKIFEYNISISNIYRVRPDKERKQLVSREDALKAHCQSSTTIYYYEIRNGKAYCVDKTFSESNSNPNNPKFPKDLEKKKKPKNPFSKDL